MSLMGIDIGTSGCKALVFDETGRILATDYNEYDVIREASGQAELDCHDVWGKIRDTIINCARQTNNNPIEAISVSSLGEALVPIDAQGNICGNSVLGMDTRGKRYIEHLTSKISSKEIYQITANLPGIGYSLPNLLRIKDEYPDMYRRTTKFVPWANFVSFMLTGKLYANYSLANRTLLFDIENCCWSKEIIDAAGLDIDKLPDLIPSGEPLGKISAQMSRELGLPSTVQVVSGTHDQCAAAIGSGVCESGVAMLGLGTYACMVLVHDQPNENSPFRKLSLNIENHAISSEYVSFVYHGSGGALVKWLRDQMFKDLEGDNAYSSMFAELSQAKDTPVVLPYFTETGPLDYAIGGQGAVCGLSFSHSRADILKAALEGIIFYFKDALEKLNKNNYPVRKIYVSGGGAQSEIWLQIIADILGIPVFKAHTKECSALGAAIIAGLGINKFHNIDSAVTKMVKTPTVFYCSPKNANTYIHKFEKYKKLIEVNVEINT